MVPRRGEKRHPILRERSEQAKSRQNSPVDCFAVERRIPDGTFAGGLLRQRESNPLQWSTPRWGDHWTFCMRWRGESPTERLPVDCCVSESRIPSNGQPLDGVTIGLFACGREEKRPLSCHLTDRHIRACQSGHFLKTASLHPPQAALQRFSQWRQNQLFALVAPAVRRTHSYPPNGVLP